MAILLLDRFDGDLADAELPESDLVLELAPVDIVAGKPVGIQVPIDETNSMPLRRRLVLSSKPGRKLETTSGRPSR
jgi:hypothetical protein